MLTTDATSHNAIILALRYFHQHGNLTNLPGGVPPGITVSNNDILIAYGYNGVQYGTLKMARGQFEVTQASQNNVNNLQNLSSYNHQGSNLKLQDYINALKSTNINANQQFVSALIILTSECCRSATVFTAIQRLMTSQTPFSADVWSGLNFAFTNYSKTSGAVGNNIQAGQNPWNPLTTGNYQTFINSQGFTGSKTDADKWVTAMASY